MGSEPQTPWPELLGCSCQSHNCNRTHAVNPQHKPAPALSFPSPPNLPTSQSNRYRRQNTSLRLPRRALPPETRSVPRPPRPEPTRRPPTPHRPPARAGQARTIDLPTSAAVGYLVSNLLHVRRQPGSQQRAFTPPVQRASFEGRPSSAGSRLLTWLSHPQPALSLGRGHALALCAACRAPPLPIARHASARARARANHSKEHWKLGERVHVLANNFEQKA